MRIAAAVVITALAHAASACITVDIEPRERFHKATVIIRATAGEIFQFKAVKSWRGGVAHDADVVGEYDLLRCGAPTIEQGKDYIIYTDEPPQVDDGMWFLSRISAVPVTNERVTRYLDSLGHGKPITTKELLHTLEEWKSGRMRSSRLHQWLVDAESRDVDDWFDDEGWYVSLKNEMLNHLLEWTRSFGTEAECAGDTLRPFAGSLLKALRWPVRDGRDAHERWDAIEEGLESAQVSADCMPADAAS